MVLFDLFNLTIKDGFSFIMTMEPIFRRQMALHTNRMERSEVQVSKLKRT